MTNPNDGASHSRNNSADMTMVDSGDGSLNFELSWSQKPSRPTTRSARGARYATLALGIEKQMRACLRRIIGDHPDVSDLVQETYLQLLNAGKSDSMTIESVRSYALVIARNKAFDWLRHRRVVAANCPRSDVEICDLLSEEAQPDELLHLQQELDLICRAISSLPDRCREVFIMLKVYGMSHKEIARRLGISVNTTEQQVTKASARLSTKLGGSSDALYSLLCPRGSVHRTRARLKRSSAGHVEAAPAAP